LSIGIFSYEQDLHALTLQVELRDRGLVSHVFETSLFAPSRGVNWSTVGGVPSTLLSRRGANVPVVDLGLVWWRRLNQSLRKPTDADPVDIDFLINEWRHAVEGVVFSAFRGTWISHPEAQRTAENKIRQLQAAAEVGLTVPATLVSANPTQIREFCAAQGGCVVAKALRGSSRRATNAVLLRLSDLNSDEAIEAAPAIYQEHIPGFLHLRAHVFGEVVSIVSILSEEMDWRRNLNVPFRPHATDVDLEARLVKVVEKLSLRMGVIDLKVSSDDQVYWMEINPQGQFLFAEALSGVPLLRHFADFIENESSR
jgi:hypothetical protein